MAYMIYQQYTSAIKQAYAGHGDIAEQCEQARSCRQWLSSLQIDPHLRGTLVEQVQALEEGFRELLVAQSREESSQPDA